VEERVLQDLAEELYEPKRVLQDLAEELREPEDYRALGPP